MNIHEICYKKRTCSEIPNNDMRYENWKYTGREMAEERVGGKSQIGQIGDIKAFECML